VARLRKSGVCGVGQSSWGPTVFALAADPADAQRIVADVGSWYSPSDFTVAVSGVSALGAKFEHKQLPS
jgi:predicted sugar kinase